MKYIGEYSIYGKKVDHQRQRIELIKDKEVDI